MNSALRRRRLAALLLGVVSSLAMVALAPPAQAAFGLSGHDIAFKGADGGPVLQAGKHPFSFITTVELNTKSLPGGNVLPAEEPKDIIVDLPPGLVGNPKPVPTCSAADFVTIDGKHNYSACPAASAVGTVHIAASLGAIQASEDPFVSGIGVVPLFNLKPPPGVASKLGFVVLGNAPVTIETRVNPDPPYNLISESTNISTVVQLFGARFTLWGTPADPAHDDERGRCAASDGTDLCPASLPQVPFLTLPTRCDGPLQATFIADSWLEPGAWTDPVIGETSDGTEPSGLFGCERLDFTPTIAAQPTSVSASSPSGLDFEMSVNDAGLADRDGIAQSEIRKTEVTLPEGFTINPSIAEGLEVCTPAQLARETAFSDPGAGCPRASKIGSVEVETPLLDENVNGALYQAAPYDNPFNSLIALYVVIKNPTLGIKVIQPLKVIPDPVTGRLTTVAEEMPQLPFSQFRLHFREGARSPLATPPKCGSNEVSATLYPWSGNPPLTTTSTFSIISGPDAGPCPSGGLPPFKPGLIAGSINNAAGRFSPFNVRLSRTDSEQEITRFSIKLPPGITAKLAGVPYCSDAQIARAIARSGPHGGQEELDNPSCPAASEVGRSLAGSGVGSALAYAPGKIYLAGPYHGSNLSIVAITAGVVGPFDIGTVVIREALRIDPETAEAFIDATGSDAIPHIIRGIPVHLRDIRAYVDKPGFTLNPTDCTRTSTASTLLGSGLDFGSEADDRPVTVSTPYQAADCAALPFKPRLSLRLKGGTRRGAHPAFKATLRMNGIGEAGIARAEVTLPKSEFIENAHFQTICTRVQFKAGAGNGTQCPAKSIYGRARAITPILAEPLTGPVFLRSSEHQLPDLVIALHNSQVDFDLVGHVDSVKGRLRNTFEAAPDAPVSSFVLEMQGGKKGLFVNSTNLCRGTHTAEANFAGQNGKRWNKKPELVPTGCKSKGRKGKAAKRGNAR